MKTKIGIIGFVLIFGCALKPSKKVGVDHRFVKDSMEVDFSGHKDKVSILDSSAMGDLDSLSSVSYFGTENGYHVFFQWSKAAAPPNDVTLFALDSTICKLEKTFPIQKQKKIGEETDQKKMYKRATFKNKTCSID